MTYNHELHDRLIGLLKRDRDHREKLLRAGTLAETYDQDMERIHIENARELKTIIDCYGWPNADIAGQDGEEAAWILAMHSISLPDFLREVLQLLQSLPHPGITMRQRIARLEDRILFFEGKKQKYGTNFDWDAKHQLSPTPIADPVNVDCLRLAIGLKPLAETIATVRQQAVQTGETGPSNPEQKAREFQAWLKKTGWR